MAYGVDSLSAFPFFTPTVFGNYFSRQYHTTVIRGIEIIYQRGGTGDTQFTSQFSELPGAVEALGVAGRAGPRMQRCSPGSGSFLGTLRQQQRTGRASTCRKGPKENTTQPQSKGRKPKCWVHALSSVSARLGPAVVMVINFLGKGRRKVDN